MYQAKVTQELGPASAIDENRSKRAHSHWTRFELQPYLNQKVQGWHFCQAKLAVRTLRVQWIYRFSEKWRKLYRINLHGRDGIKNPCPI